MEEHERASVEEQIAGEKAAALGRSGRRLQLALESLRRFDAVMSAHVEPADPAVRAELVEIAGEALWSYIVQREAMGLMDREYIAQEYRVPQDVWRRMRPRLSR